MNTKEIAAKLNWAMQAVPLAKEQKDEDSGSTKTWNYFKTAN